MELVSKFFQIKNKGFTMVELLVVIGLLGVLTTIGFTSYTNSMKVSRDARRKADLETIRQGLELYKSDNGSYPAGSGTAQVLATPLASPNSYISGTNFPKDPNSTKNMIYYYNRTANSTYYLCTYLENASAAYPCPGTVDCNTSSVTQNCNYGVTQP